MGMYETDFVYDVPCLSRVYVKNMEDGREYDLVSSRGGEYAGREDGLVVPGMAPFEGTLWGEWKSPEDGSVVRVKWPALPPFVERGTVVLTDEDRERAEERPECEAIYLIDGDAGDEIHVFYDRAEGIWEPEWEGLKSPTMHVRAFWSSGDGELTEELDWDDRPSWLEEK